MMDEKPPGEKIEFTAAGYCKFSTYEVFSPPEPVKNYSLTPNADGTYTDQFGNLWTIDPAVMERVKKPE